MTLTMTSRGLREWRQETCVPTGGIDHSVTDGGPTVAGTNPAVVAVFARALTTFSHRVRTAERCPDLAIAPESVKSGPAAQPLASQSGHRRSQMPHFSRLRLCAYSAFGRVQMVLEDGKRLRFAEAFHRLILAVVGLKMRDFAVSCTDPPSLLSFSYAKMSLGGGAGRREGASAVRASASLAWSSWRAGCYLFPS